MVTFLLALFPPIAWASGTPEMTKRALFTQLQTFASDIHIEGTELRFTHRDVLIVCTADTFHDRMMIAAPVTKVKDLSPDELQICLGANFRTTMDARYAISDGVLYSTFAHPLSSLTPEHIRDAVNQVANAKLTFGSAYSGGSIVYCGH